MNTPVAPRWMRFTPLAFALLGTCPLAGQVAVSPAASITHRVQIQPVRVKKSNGTAATTFGTVSQETYIKEQINRVWAQLGVEITWLPFTEYTSDFAYDGSPTNYTSATRPTSHLARIVDGAGAPPKSGNAIVLNLFFVEIVPGFSQVGENSANGLAFVDSNGIAMQVGTNLLGWQAGRDVIASVAAHEIGHNLGLSHEAGGTTNLMSPGGTGEVLTNTQKNTVFSNRSGIDGFEFLQTVPQDSRYQLWAAASGLTGGPGDDDDRDGISNVIEFMLGLDPRASSRLPVPVSSPAGLTWTLPKNADALADGLVYRVESGDSLSWLPAGTAGSGSTVLQNGSSSLVVRLNAGAPRRFMRFNVDIPESLSPAAASFFPAAEAAAGERKVASCGHAGCGIHAAVK